MNDAVIKELHDLAHERVSTALNSVIQLLENDQQAAHLMCAVLARLVLDTARCMREAYQDKDGKPLSKQEAYLLTLNMLCKLQGIETKAVSEQDFEKVKSQL